MLICCFQWVGIGGNYYKRSADIGFSQTNPCSHFGLVPDFVVQKNLHVAWCEDISMKNDYTVLMDLRRTPRDGFTEAVPNRMQDAYIVTVSD